MLSPQGRESGGKSAIGLLWRTKTSLAPFRQSYKSWRDGAFLSAGTSDEQTVWEAAELVRHSGSAADAPASGFAGCMPLRRLSILPIPPQPFAESESARHRIPRFLRLPYTVPLWKECRAACLAAVAALSRSRQAGKVS